MKLRILIRRVSDGVTREVVLDEDPAEGFHRAWFDWGMNNHSCDCNRAIAFDRAGGADIDLDAYKCGDGAYRVRLIAPDGAVVLAEFEA